MNVHTQASRFKSVSTFVSAGEDMRKGMMVLSNALIVLDQHEVLHSGCGLHGMLVSEVTMLSFPHAVLAKEATTKHL